MKRLSYISRLSVPFAQELVADIVRVAGRNNARDEITGVLICFAQFFFQIIEGEDEKIDRLYEKIGRDPRHTDLVCLRTELDIDGRLFPEWSMQVIDLNENAELLVRPVRILLETLSESHELLRQYTQPSVLQSVYRGINPLSVPVRKVERIVLFTDIVSFSRISEALPVEQVAILLNRYLETTSEIIASMGGEVTKFVGDCVMAYFAPEQADAALEACLRILRKLDRERTTAGHADPVRLLYSGFGLAQGMVIEGNLGSRIKKDYTIVGDPVNTAAKLEALTRDLGRALILCDRVMENTRLDWRFVPLGTYDLKGKRRQARVYSIDHRLVNDFDAGAVEAAVARTIPDPDAPDGSPVP
jgi:class 3 adenylate cyclase